MIYEREWRESNLEDIRKKMAEVKAKLEKLKAEHKTLRCVFLMKGGGKQ
jgi:hypothetical protein